MKREKIETKPPKENCKFFNEHMKNCEALNSLYCKIEECAFFKPNHKQKPNPNQKKTPKAEYNINQKPQTTFVTIFIAGK